MRQIYLLTICLFTFGILSAQEENLSKEEKARREKNIQAGNPFAKYGYKAKVATLSKGKYLEVHDLDSIVTIGTIRWNVNQNKIVGNIVRDTTDMYAQPIGDTAGRWLSPDPLSDEFPEWSPYTSMNDNPINYVDPTGMASEWVPTLNEDGSASYIAEKGDSASTLSSQYGISQDKAEAITGTTGDTEIAAGTEISGQTVSNVTGSEVLKLDLNSKEGQSSQRRFDQFLFARDHSSSQGAFAFLSTDYYSNTKYKDVISGRASMNIDGQKVGVLYNIPLYRPATLDGSSRATALSNQPLNLKYTSGNSFSNQANVELPLYHPNTLGQMGNYTIYTQGSNATSVFNRLDKSFPKYNYLNTPTKTKN